MKDLDGKVAVITGGASGIGLAIAEELGDAGMRLVLADVDEVPLKAAVEDLTARGFAVIGVATDVSSAEQVDQLRDRTEEAFGPAHVLCNNAGVERLGITTWEIPLELWNWIMGVNLWGVIHGVRSFVPGMVARGEGHVINISSLAGLVVSPDHAAYNAAKHAVVSISESLYHEFRAQNTGVGVSVVLPKLVRSGILTADRNWPAELGALPPQGDYQREALSRIDSAPPASDVAVQVRDAIVNDRFWVLPQGGGEKVLERFQVLVDGGDPPELWKAVIAEGQEQTGS